MNCPNCNAQIPDGARFCDHCGADLDETAVDDGLDLDTEVSSDEYPAGEDYADEVEQVPEEPWQAPRRTVPQGRGMPPEKPRRRSRVWIWILVIVLLLAALGGGAVWYLHANYPGPMTDEQIMALLPPGSTIIASMYEKKDEQVDYSYTERFTYCDVEVTERLKLAYSKEGWAPTGEPETLGEEEDWTRLTGVWTELPEEATGLDLAIDLTGFSGTLPTANVTYTDAGSTHSGTFSAFFSDGVKGEDGAYRFEGQEIFQSMFLRIDRSNGLFFNNELIAMEKDAPPREPEVQKPDPGTLEIEGAEGTEEVPIGGETAPVQQLITITTLLNVRPEPNTNNEPLGTVDLGTVMPFTAVSDGWYQVEYEGGTGYVSADYVQDLTGLAEGTVNILSATTDVNVRSGPGTNYDRLDTLKTGDKMVATGLADGWYKIRYNDADAYIFAEYVKVEAAVQ